jgi:hypothetical protein
MQRFGDVSAASPVLMEGALDARVVQAGAAVVSGLIHRQDRMARADIKATTAVACRSLAFHIGAARVN